MPHSSAFVTEGAYSPTARITLIASSPRPCGEFARRGDFAAQRLEVGRVDDGLGRVVLASIERALQQVGMEAAQVDRADRADAAERRHAAGKAVRRDAHPHAALHDGQQRATAQAQRLQPATRQRRREIGIDVGIGDARRHGTPRHAQHRSGRPVTLTA